MGSRIVVMNQGRIEQIGEPLAVYNRPASLFVARFLGLPEINTVPGRLAGSDGGTRFEGADFALPLPDRAGSELDVMLGLRPQVLSGSLTPQPGGISLGEARVTAVEHHGPESFATCVLGTTQLTVQITPGAPVHIGSRLSIAADLSNPHFFDVNTGRRIEELDIRKPARGAFP